MTKTTTKLGFSSTRNYWGWVVLSVFSVVIAIASMRYVIGVGPVAEVIPLNKFKDPWIILHAGFASLALLIGPFQFIQKIRSRFPMLHRWLGRVYVLSCTAGGVAGIMLALGASTGLISTFGFGLLGVFWIGCTSMAWRCAINRQFAEHQKWMIRSFALTLSAVTLRLYLPSVLLFPYDDFPIIYRAISFLCWVPNLLIAEWYLAHKKHA